MKKIPKEQILKRLHVENLWWGATHQIDTAVYGMRRRAYFELFMPLVKALSVRRAVLLMGPRRVGKTVMIYQTIQQLIEEGVPPRQIFYVSVDHPLYNGCHLEDLKSLFQEASGADLKGQQAYIFFDEIQYKKGWETHLKSLVDENPNIKFVASGSAAAALRLKSIESGAGRFTEFLLPPLTFHEYLNLLQLEGDDVFDWSTDAGRPRVVNIQKLNDEFINYINFGGYPEALFSEPVRRDPARFIKNDIVDKVLLRDLPGLYGIQDIQELNYLFTTLAYNTADEVSLEGLSERSGVAKNTLKRYIDYLEAAFLIKVVHRINRNARRFQRANFFKVYLTNPSMRSALFSPIQDDDADMGKLAETGIFSQWFHGKTDSLHYARWPQGEVDIVRLDVDQRPRWAVEVKWSDRHVEDHREIRNLLAFCKRNKTATVAVTTKTISARQTIDGVNVDFVPTSLYCYIVGYNLVKNRRPTPE